MTPAVEQYFTFRIGGDDYAVPLLRMREILAFRPLTRIPATPAYIRGVFSLVGEMIPVLDLSIKFGFGETAIHPRSCVVVTEIEVDDEPMVLGLLVDEIGEVIEMPREALEPPPPFGMRVRLDYLAGVGRLGGRVFLLLDLEHVISSLEIFGFNRLAAASAP